MLLTKEKMEALQDCLIRYEVVSDHLKLENLHGKEFLHEIWNDLEEVKQGILFEERALKNLF